MPRPQVIELTSKRWKLIQAIGVGGIILGAILFFSGPVLSEDQDTARLWGMVGFGVGILSVPVYISAESGRGGITASPIGIRD